MPIPVRRHIRRKRQSTKDPPRWIKEREQERKQKQVPIELLYWIEDTDPLPLEDALKRKDPALLAYAKKVQRQLDKEGSRGRILYRAEEDPDKMGHRQFSSWTDDPLVADELAVVFPDRQIVAAYIPNKHILAVYGENNDLGLLADLDREYIVMHHIPVSLDFDLLFEESGIWGDI